jgi:hypothetical protein
MQPVLVEALVRSQLPETFLYIFNSLVGKCRAGQGTKPLCHCEPTGCANARPTTGSAKPRSVFSRHSGARVRRANPEIYRAATILEKWLSGPAFRGASMNDETLDCFGAHAPRSDAHLRTLPRSSGARWPSLASRGRRESRAQAAPKASHASLKRSTRA